MCDCKLCIRLRSIEAKIMELPEEHREYFRGMVETMLDVEFDNDYYKVILSGQWPGAREILECSLQKCKEREDKNGS